MATEPTNQPEHVATEVVNAGLKRLRQGLDEVDALLAEAEEMLKAREAPLDADSET